MGNSMVRRGALAAIAITAAMAPIAQARPAAGVTYGGKTSAKWPIMVQVSRDGRQVSYAIAAWSTTCTDGPYGDTEEFAQIPISATGKFGVSYDSGDYQQGSATLHNAVLLDGKLNKRHSKITGKVRVMFSVKDPANNVDYTCDTGTVAYVALD
jgi:hypothetical protein